MNTRRKFLLQGSAVTTALLTNSPFNNFANRLSPLTGYTINDNKVVVVHTGNHGNNQSELTKSRIKELKQSTGNLLLLHAGNVPGSNEYLNYDASINTENNFIFKTGYKIIYKGNIKIGVVTATDDKVAAIDELNSLTAYLKNEKKCHLVVCLSALGYKSNNTDEGDFMLASNSTNLDIIVGSHPKNFTMHPVIALNKNNEEVIINHAAGNGLSLGKIEIDFDGAGKKRGIDFCNA